MGYSVLCRKLCQMENRRLVMVMCILATVVLAFQSFMLPHGNAFSSIFPAVKVTVLVKRSFMSENSSHRSTRVGEFPQSSNLINSTDLSVVLGVLKITKASDTGVGTSEDNKIREKERDSSHDFALEKDGDTNYDFELDAGNDFKVEKVTRPVNGSMVEISRELQNGVSPEKVRKPGNGSVSYIIIKSDSISALEKKPQWSSACDMELLSSMTQIENAPIVESDHELYGPVFRNVSMFKRSYELMERKLNVYVYEEGEKPIFHTPFLRGIYASEGWFMKLMEGNKQFVVNQPWKAHLFYLPFSSRILRTKLHKPELHGRKNLVEYLKDFVDEIDAKYPFWNRTCGADHFLVACHDWVLSS